MAAGWQPAEWIPVVNNEIKIIPACFLSAYALSMGWEWSVCGRAVASVVRDCCRWAWLLKYNFYEMLRRKELLQERYQRTPNCNLVFIERTLCKNYIPATGPQLELQLLFIGCVHTDTLG